MPGKRHNRGRGGRTRLLIGLLAPWAVMAGGCGFWDDFRAADYSPKAYFAPEPPLSVLSRDEPSADKRARALSRLEEPKQHGGSDRDQEYVILLLDKIVTEDPQALCRLSAVEALSRFKDPKAAEILAKAYYKAEVFPPDTRKILRMQTMTALGKVGNPASVDLLAGVLQAPPLDPAKSSESEKQNDREERLAAARALEHFKHYRATEALVKTMKGTRDVALRDSAHESLVAITGNKKLPADGAAWEEFLSKPNDPNRGVQTAEGERKVKLGSPILRTGLKEEKAN
jgi:HEAT repeat protein